MDIAKSVGSLGVNDDADVLTVQTLLNTVSIAAGGASPVLDLDGWCGKNTNTAISKFQTQQFGFHDGRVDPGKKTITRLNELAAGAGTRPVPTANADPKTTAIGATMQATIWGAAGLKAISDAIAKVNSAAGFASIDSINRTALGAHFKIVSTMTKAQQLLLLGIVQKNFTEALTTIAGAATVYRTVSRRQMNLDMQGKGEVPGYTFVKQRICYSEIFHPRTTGPRPGRDWAGDGFGPKCLAAMVLHEPVHFVDTLANFDTYEHGPEYAALRAERAVHNASSYPSFAAHVQERSTLPLGPRYGAGRPAD